MIYKGMQDKESNMDVSRRIKNPFSLRLSHRLRILKLLQDESTKLSLDTLYFMYFAATLYYTNTTMTRKKDLKEFIRGVSQQGFARTICSSGPLFVSTQLNNDYKEGFFYRPLTPLWNLILG